MKIFETGYSENFDGPGTRLIYYLKGCNFHCDWCGAPESISPETETLHYPERTVVAGKEISPEEILKKALAAQDFISGVTFGGGEPTLQAAELLRALKLLKEHNIHTALESNGSTPAYPEAAKLVDWLFTDLKTLNKELFARRISSNLERLLYHLYKNDAQAAAALMSELNQKGKYEVAPAVLEEIRKEFYAGFCDEEETQKTIAALFSRENYLCDTHTAVAVKVYGDYRKETGDETPCIIASTASPYKFADSVLSAIDNSPVPQDGFELLEKLSQVSGTPVPAPLSELKSQTVLHKSCVQKEEMAEFIRKFL